MKSKIHICFFIVLIPAIVMAGIIKVPEDHKSIQDGINAAVNGDTVLVADSTYYENINFLGKAIFVASYFLVDRDSVHLDSTIINGSQPADPDLGSVVRFVSGEDTNSTLYGFTITGGTGTLYDSNNRIGGGIYFENSGARVACNKIVENSITSSQNCWGGGIGTYPLLHDLHQILIEDNIIEYNTLKGADRNRGGGICLIQGRIVGNNICFNSCSSVTNSSVGGGIFSYCDTTFNRAVISIEQNNIRYNQVTSRENMGIGGGVDIQHCNVYLSGNIISYNKAGGTTPYGCGIRIRYSRESSFVKDNMITHNTYTTHNGACWGGGLQAEYTTGLKIQNNKFIDNIAYNWGGGISDKVTFGTIISGNEFISNAVDPDYGGGGGVGCYASNNLTITGNLFKQNSAYQCGGFASQNSIILLTHNLFIHNQAHEAGALAVSQDPPIPLLRSYIINNTITGNIADIAGGIELDMGLELILLNTICWGNNANFAPEIYLKGGKMVIANSDIRFGKDSVRVDPGAALDWFESNIDANPLFSDTINFCLQENSPCIDAGDDSSFFYDTEDEENEGFAKWPAMGSIINDQGIYGGPHIYDFDELNDVVDIITKIPPRSLHIAYQYKLYQNYPNPFNPVTIITYQLPKSNDVGLIIYNLLGQKVTTLVNGYQKAGYHQIKWDASGYASGVYYYRIQAGEFQEVKKMILLK